ncbi:hypothetical protein J2Y45_004147 [Dyadobacter sp. BE34]|uniref:Glycosyl-4,4'-diaponeurosporenoate acyltransferase n=1 Tax=Dyadobacter fermentans TaxID=94254 RepID=A0ABU1R0R0_9BACT|nr:MULTISPECIES: hypothetical protein [Dyadobacter]MDR6806955.1 hypothetical protein [Dyadobacter fermentans]MDR7044697.1 hypothetical protein [Dyadobacter sp. BE242]MDR7199007.1 hypothetical protein [Dyadobacter sp. BE34]MDR7216969.1 hypothetical protein [Dyadobacter sp. BE31]MDR7263505.1 hypothetical protein [Dyadobacter sp. BE32]
MLNQLINVLWTVLSFSVVGWYWGDFFAEKRGVWLLCGIVAVSVLVFHIPARLISALSISKNPRTYELMGIRVMRWFVQDGTLVNRVHQHLGKRRRVISNLANARQYLSKIAVQERYHYSCFVFFTLSALSAVAGGKIEMALLISMANVIYNVYPILLQQYNRLRIQRLLNLPGV